MSGFFNSEQFKRLAAEVLRRRAQRKKAEVRRIKAFQPQPKR